MECALRCAIEHLPGNAPKCSVNMALVDGGDTLCTSAGSGDRREEDREQSAKGKSKSDKGIMGI
jgi:hypothetical protein